MIGQGLSLGKVSWCRDWCGRRVGLLEFLWGQPLHTTPP